MAVHDGPGLRTTLFLKGCPLSCLWCHNPEGQAGVPELAFYANKCLGCGKCEQVCPQGGKMGYPDSRCIVCGACAGVCPGGARKLYGRSLSIEEALKLCLEDRAFYGTLGGVTLSGGEPLFQPVFALELLKRLKQEGIHTALDTSGYAAKGVFERALDVCDLFLFDIKHTDPEKHKALTGVDNKLILSNLKLLSDAGARIQVRMPIIPGLNDEDANIAAAAKLLKPLKVEKIKLLAYKELARMKYTALQKSDVMPARASDTEARVKQIVEYFKANGLNAYTDV